MYKVIFCLGVLLATAYTHSIADTLSLDEVEHDLIPRVQHKCVHDDLEADPMKEWKAKYVLNPFVTMEEHIESYRSTSLRNTLLAAPWEELRI